jgi:hypothetical protein
MELHLVVLISATPFSTSKCEIHMHEPGTNGNWEFAFWQIRDGTKSPYSVYPGS